MRKSFQILVIMLMCILIGCTKSDIVTTYEEVKEVVEGPTPVIFSPYIGSVNEDDATTRADLNYIVYYIGTNNTPSRYNNIVFESQQANNGRRIGHLAYNNYIVGVYGFWHQGSDWEHSKATAEADFMTNQPLEHLVKTDGATEKIVYEYSPLKYWPNNNTVGGINGYSSRTDCVTFISYYPYQGYKGDEYYRDGIGTITTPMTMPASKTKDGIVHKIDDINYYSFTKNDPVTTTEKNLTNIIPPTADKTGSAAYTFGFKQKDNPKDHIDFMLGINTDVTKCDKVLLNLRHALCCVIFGTDFNPTKSSSSSNLSVVPNFVEWEIKSISLNGVYDVGTVTPDWDYTNNKVVFNWDLEEKEENKKDYSVFVHAKRETQDLSYPYYKANFVRSGGSYEKSGEVKRDAGTIYNDYSANVRGEYLKWLILALPQFANDDTYVEVVYDLKYTFNQDKDGNSLSPAQTQTYFYKDCHEKFKVNNSLFFNAGTILKFNLRFYLKGVSMDAEVKEWPTDEELEVEGEIDG